MDEIIKRIDRIFSGISSENDPEALFIFNTSMADKNFLYVSGLQEGVFENCGAIIERDGKRLLLTTSLEEEMISAVKMYDDILVYRDEREREITFKKFLSSYKSIGICYDQTPFSFYSHLSRLLHEAEFVDVSDAFREARMIKSQDEISCIEKACKIATDTLEEVPALLKEGITELDLAAEIDYLLTKKGASGPAFKTIVSFAANTSKPHYRGGSTTLRAGNPVLVDFGAEYMGYNSDITHVYLTGSPEKKLIDLFSTINEAKEMATSSIKDGVVAKELGDRVKEYIDSHDQYKGRFIHSLGHSIGLDVHDDSYPIKSFDGKFVENMVLTVEPGIYLPGLYGVRLEDDIVVKKDLCIILTSRKAECTAYEI
ncbi:MAG: aminopeptidase P family protein [Spirochaetota bacterium]|nr:MAG: aminopeptidase P family protein [Spirochaetota bacterium]